MLLFVYLIGTVQFPPHSCSYPLFCQSHYSGDNSNLLYVQSVKKTFISSTQSIIVGICTPYCRNSYMHIKQQALLKYRWIRCLTYQFLCESWTWTGLSSELSCEKCQAMRIFYETDHSNILFEYHTARTLQIHVTVTAVSYLN